MSKLDFVEKMMDSILEGAKIPKVQVERAVAPIIGVFIDSLLTKYFSLDDKYSGTYELIAPEFPLKKENNQSTNIDYLLINIEKKFMVFLELKTDVSSFKKEQADIYLGYKQRVHDNTALVLYEDLLKIQEASIKKSKYQYLADKCSKYIDVMKQLNELIIVYLVPEPIKKQVKEISEIDSVMAFKELPINIKDDYVKYWEIIREYLTKLDLTENGLIPEEDISYLNIIENVNADIKILLTSKHPLGIRLGNKGKGYRPNYQIRFDDGSVKAFLNNGKAHKVAEFNPYL